MKKSILLAGCALCIAQATLAQKTYPLYETVPNSKPSAMKEEVVQLENGPRVSRVTQPTLTVFEAPDPRSGLAVIICPGGGYSRLAYGHEGEAIAKVLNGWGVTAFVLKYRLPSDSIMQNKTIGPLQDAQRAIQLVRENAVRWHVNPGKIGIMGFSAGGHLASTLSTHYQPVIENPNGTSLRPDFSILVYPVISFTDSLAHRGSRERLLGTNPAAGEIQLYSNEWMVDKNTPPAFLVHAADDKTVPVANSLVYYEALIRAKVPAEMHLYERGGHGFGMNNPTTEDKWMERLKNWLVSRKLM